MLVRDRKLRLTLVALCGILIGFSGPPFSTGIFCVFTYVPFFFAFESIEDYKTGVIYSYVTYLILHVIVCYWMMLGKHVYLLVSGLLFIVFDPLFFALPVIAWLFIRRRFGFRRSLLSFPFIWVAFEYLRTKTDIAVPFFTHGNSQTYDLSVIQIASITGVHGISFWLFWLNVVLYFVVSNIVEKRWKLRSRETILSIIGIVVLFAIPKIYGSYVLEHASDDIEKGQAISLGIVQPNIDPYEKWDGNALKQIAVLQSLTTQAATKDVDLVLWPETAIPLYIFMPDNQDTLRLIRQQIDSLGIPLLTGYTDWVYYEKNERVPKSSKWLPDGRRYDIYNSAMLLKPKSDEIQKYNKILLLPFGERVPFAEELSFLDVNVIRWNFGTGGYGIGRDTTVFRCEGKRNQPFAFSTLICFESVFPGFVREFVEMGAKFLVVITNDTWWGASSIPYQHNQLARLRAVENRRWLVRCANGGISCVIDPYGRTLQETQLFTRTAMNANVQPRSDLSFYTRHGDWLAIVCVVVFLVTIVVGLAQKLYRFRLPN